MFDSIISYIIIPMVPTWGLSYLVVFTTGEAGYPWWKTMRWMSPSDERRKRPAFQAPMIRVRKLKGMACHPSWVNQMFFRPLGLLKNMFQLWDYMRLCYNYAKTYPRLGPTHCIFGGSISTQALAALVASLWTGLLPKRFLELLQGEENQLKLHMFKEYTPTNHPPIILCVYNILYYPLNHSLRIFRKLAKVKTPHRCTSSVELVKRGKMGEE